MTIFNSDCSVSHLCNLIIMCDHYNCLIIFLTCCLKKSQNILACFTVQISCWLICKDYCRLRCKGSCDCNSLLLSTGKLCWKSLKLLLNSKSFYYTINKLLICFLSIQLNWKDYIVINRNWWYQVEALENETNLSSSKDAKCITTKLWNIFVIF